ncbi:hypothetical protein LRAMOSA01263 [Lichtheimia ramosa]|uniref:Calcium-activated potassium channel BK alpha subunit domain-containing protein n=1 Tax=Lichtheimia ramosa TaxID=688394 RepID=A0A077WJK8_9FUNG|nr:hypothetical protein LRAMOSA01263 [Lichtheimia ramosa]
MEGNCRQPDDLLHAGIKRAKQVVVMSEKESADGQETDSAAIMTSHIIHLLLHSRRQDSYTIVNLVERSNIKFMHLLQGKQVDDEEIDVFYTPAYAAGDVVAESLISNVLLSQTYSKPEIVQVIRAMSGMPVIHHSHLTSHLGYSSSSKTEYTTRHQHTSSTAKASTCRFASMPVPDSFVGKTFVALFEAWLLDHGILALGLFRAPTAAFGNELPFVYSNPVPSLMLLESDHVYVLVAQQS